MLLMLPSLGRVWEESEAVTDSVPVLSQKGTGKLWNHLWNGASRTRYLEASDMEPAGTCSSMNTVTCEGGDGETSMLAGHVRRERIGVHPYCNTSLCQL